MHQHGRRKSLLYLSAVAAMALSVALFRGVVRAQYSSVPMPDTGEYGLDASDQGPGYGSPNDLSMPSADMGMPPDSVSIPIPGGGQVSVDGPEPPQENGISTNPGSNWGEQVQAPASQGVGPIGP